MQGDIINIITGGVKTFLDKDSIKVDKLGKWIAFQLKKNNKKVVIIIFYYIPNSSVQGVYKSIKQYNKMNGKQDTATIYWKQTFKEIEDYCNSIEDLNDIIIAGDINQNIAANEV